MAGSQFWCETTDGDPAALAMYLRHYSSHKARSRGRRAVGAGKLFVGPGSKLVLITPWQDAVFAWRKAEHRRDGQAGVECTIFRNESAMRSSEMILDAERIAWRRFPGERLFTFVDASAIQSRNPGYCFQCADWRRCGVSANGKIVLEKLEA